MSERSPDLTDKHVGSRVRMRRLVLGMSLTKLAGAVGLSFQQVQKYEAGTNRISASRLQEFSRALQVPVTFFFEGVRGRRTKGLVTAPDYTSELFATKEGLELIKVFLRIKDARRRRRVMALVKEIAGDG